MRKDSTKTIILGPLKLHLSMIASIRGHEKVAVLLGKKRDETTVVTIVFRVDNVRRSPIEFEGDPWQLVVAHKTAEKYGLEIVGVFHTHPTCPPLPSPSDVEGMRKWPYPWVIACPGEMRAWELVDEGKTAEVSIE